jgi:RND superfamily putative drug exporter
METTNVLLPTGDRLQIPTGAETLRLKSFLVIQRNSTRDYTELSELIDSMDTHTAAEVLTGMDRYYSGPSARDHWVATQLVRRLADPRPADGPDVALSGPDAETEWARVRQRCLSVAVAMLEEAR